MITPPKFVSPKVHVGAIKSAVAGRTDHLPMHVKSGSYVIPADVVSHHGENNSAAGFKVMKSIFTAPNRTGGTPYGESGLPYGGATPHKADGGEVDGDVPIVAAGGEYVVEPEDVAWLGGGNLDSGHRILDEFVLQSRKNHIDTLKGLAPPRKD